MEVLYLPLALSIICIFFRGKAVRSVALIGSLMQLGYTAYMLSMFNADGSYNFSTRCEWIPMAGITFRIGIDGISMMMVLLSNIVFPLIILANYNKDTKNPHAFYSLLSFMQFAMLGVFISLDGILFYTFWELALLPIYFISAIWGGHDKNRITIKFFIYTFLGSLLMLAALIVMKNLGGSFDIDMMYAATLAPKTAAWVLSAFFIAFAIKIPVFPFHTWQPDTYTVSPLGGTMMLSGIMLKMGLYGVLRWMLPMAPEGWSIVGDWFIGLAVVGVVYASLIAITQKDFKRLIAYSSIGHVGLIAAGIMTLNASGMQGGLIQMLNHGINVVGLFLVVDIIEQRLGTRELAQMGGIAKSAPRFATLFMVVMLGAVAVPLTNGFVGEFLLLKGLFDHNSTMGIIAGLTIIFGAVYMLRSYQLSMFGPQEKNTTGFKDLNANETLVLGVISVAIIVLGFYPQPLFDITSASADKLIEFIKQGASVK